MDESLLGLKQVEICFRREKEETDFDRSAGKEVAGGLLHGPAEAVRREDRGHRREARPQEERRQGLVLQPAAEAEEDEVRVSRAGAGRSGVGPLRLRPLGGPRRRRRDGRRRRRSGPGLQHAIVNVVVIAGTSVGVGVVVLATVGVGVARLLLRVDAVGRQEGGQHRRILKRPSTKKFRRHRSEGQRPARQRRQKTDQSGHNRRV